MSKQNSIRQAANSKFLELLPARVNTPKGNAAFRKSVVAWLVESFDCTWAAGCTHYAYAFNRIKQSEPELVPGLGRAEGKNNGGRKKKVAVELVGPIMPLMLGYSPDAATAVISDAAAMVGLEDLQQGADTLPEETPEEAPQEPAVAPAPEVEAAVPTFTVVRKRDGAEVATGLSLTDAEAMVNKAASARFTAKLMIKE